MIAAPRDLRPEVVWHDVECGGYGADLPIWAELADAAGWGRGGGADVLELGCGTGRVSLHLAARGHAVAGVDLDEALLAAFLERAGGRGLAARVTRADARNLELGARFDLVIAPMQLAQLLDEAGRRAMLAGVAAHLALGGFAAFAVMDRAPAAWRAERGSPAPAPDVREVEGWVYSSLPVAIEPDGDGVRVHRLRQTVSPAGELSEAEDVVRLHGLPPERLAEEAAAAGLRQREQRHVPATDDHLGSAIVVCEAQR